MFRSIAIFLVFVPFLAAGCTLLSGPPDGADVLGTIALGTAEPVLLVPDTAISGKPFEVSFETYGSSCLHSGETTVEMSEMVARIRGMDVAQEAEECGGEVNTFVHTAEITFPGAGEAHVVLTGFQKPSGAIIQVERVVHILPAATAAP